MSGTLPVTNAPLLYPAPWSSTDDASDITRFTQQLIDQPHIDRFALVQLLIRIQHRFGWVPPAARSLLESHFGISDGELLGIIDFYWFLDHRFQGEYQLLFSRNITDEFAGVEQLARQLCQRLGCTIDEVRSDRRVRVGFTSCTGLCEQGPAALVNGRVLTRLDSNRIQQLAALIEQRAPFDQWPAEWFAVERSIRHAANLLDAPRASGEALSRVITEGDNWLLQELEQSALRGRGGAGFNTYQKLWSTCRQAEGRAHYVVCNADEGEPGTYKDRVLLQHCPDAVFEGMTIAARVIGAKRGLVYLRGEYAFLYDGLNELLQQRRDNGLLGENIGGDANFSFDIDIHLGAGAYVCGEESALIESLEGKRGVPRIRPPYPVTCGYRQQPTLVNNVETFACVTQIAREGGAQFASLGTASSAGTKLHSISGDCAAPGIYEFPWGISVRELLRSCGGEDAAMVQIGGPSGTLLFANEFDRTLDFDDIPTGGSFMVFNRDRDLCQLLRNFAFFFAHESCGFCTPCRSGCQQLEQISNSLVNGSAHPKDLERIEALAAVMIGTSHCGLGKTAALPLQQALASRRELLQSRVIDSQHIGFNLEAAIAESRRIREGNA